MKKLLFLLLLIAQFGVSQVANPAPDLNQCGNEVFDLTVQTPIILGNQNPQDFTVSYHLSMADANANTNAIGQPTVFIAPQSTVVFARVTENSSGDFAVTSFNVSWDVPVQAPNGSADVTTCDFYILPPPIPGHGYSSAPDQIISFPNNVVTQTQTVYVIPASTDCYIPGSFQVTIVQATPVSELPDMFVCDSFTLPSLPPGEFYNTMANGAGTELFAGFVLTASQQIFVNNGNSPCYSESDFIVTIAQTPTPPFLQDVWVCDAYVLPALPPDFGYYTGPGGSGNSIPVSTVITESQTIYVFGQTFPMPNCMAESSFTVNIGGMMMENLSDFVNCETDGDGITTFDLTLKEGEAIGSSAATSVVFYETLADAQAGVNPIGNVTEYTNTSNPQTLYASLILPFQECWMVSPFNLVVTSCTGNTVTGIVRFDADNNGCTEDDAPMPNFQIGMTTGNSMQYAFTDANGQYVFENVQPGISIVWPSGTTAGMTPFPTAQTLNVGESDETHTVDFCIQGPAEFDGRIYLYALSVARPGFPAHYSLLIQNQGSAVINGSATLTFDDNRLNYTSSSPAASQTGNTLTFTIDDIQPFQSLSIPITFQVETPPTATAGNLIFFGANLSLMQDDTNLLNNYYGLSQVLVDSYDPNDKAVHELAFDIDNTQDYLHYVVRFQNTGTADAINVRIEDQLDENLNWSTFRPVASSHPNSVSIDGNGKVTFNFPNINLPAEQDDEPASHGYVFYEVKLKPGLTVNDDIYNTAEIYFDFNEAIVTNTVVTDLMALGTPHFNNDKFALYPNPASSSFSIVSDVPVEFSITDAQGKTIVKGVASGYEPVDVSQLQSGLYFVRVSADGKQAVRKLIIR